MSKGLKVILSGGGTGGHIYPAIAIAKEIEKLYPDSSILFVGASDRMEMQKVPQAGYEIIGLWISGIQRKLTWSNLMFPFKLLSSLLGMLCYRYVLIVLNKLLYVIDTLHPAINCIFYQ